MPETYYRGVLIRIYLIGHIYIIGCEVLIIISFPFDPVYTTQKGILNYAEDSKIDDLGFEFRNKVQNPLHSMLF